MEALMTQNVAGAMLNVNHAFTSVQPRFPRRMGSNGAGRLDLSIVGLGTQYPSNNLEPGVMDVLASRHYRDSPAMRKTLSINHNAGIEHRSSIITQDHPLINQDDAPSISDLHHIFVQAGIPLAIRAAQIALQEAKLDTSQVTHIVCTTNTDNSSPGLDALLEKGLGIGLPIEKALLRSAGGLALLRTGANLALGYTAMGKPARVLCVALDINTTMLRSELDTVDEEQEARIGACLFSDGSSALVLSNGMDEPMSPVFELLRWNQRTLPGTEDDYGFDAQETGFKPRLSFRLPDLLGNALSPSYSELLGVPLLQTEQPHPSRFDWAMEPLGGPVLSGAEEALSIAAEHLRASYETYNKHGHAGSAAMFSVLDRLRSKDMDAMTSQGRGKDYIIGCSFGPGIVLDMCMLRKPKGGGRNGAPQLQSRTGSETSVTSGDSESLGSEGRGTPARGAHMADALKSLDLDHME